MEKYDAHNYRRKVELALRRIKKSDLPEESKRLIEEFSEYCIAEGLTAPTVAKYLFCLRNVAKWARKELDKTDKNDIIRIVNILENSNYSGHVKHDIKISIKKFYKWLNGGEEYPKKVKWIKSVSKIKKKLPEELLTNEDVKKMINVADHPRDKALVSLIYESGFRVGEVLNLCIKHVVFDEYGAKIMGNGKTGMRRIRLVSSVPLIAAWTEIHPLRDRPDAPLWVGTGTRNKNKIIRYESVRRLISKLAKKADVKKRVYPHLFRHTRATHLSEHFTDAQLDEYFGWVQGSKQPSTYVHLSGKNIDSAVLKLYGLKEEEKRKEEFTPKKCFRCEKMNPPTGKFCLRCGAPLDLDTAMKIEKERDRMDTIMTSLMKKMLDNPDIRSFIERELKADEN